MTKRPVFPYSETVKTLRQECIDAAGREQQEEGHDVEAKEFGQFIAGIRKEKKMTQAELAEQIHVTDKAVSRWERGLGFPDIQTLEPLLKRDKNLENDWLIGDESWREGNKNTFQIRVTYYADAEDAKEGRESEYQYKIQFDDFEGYVIKSEGVPEKEIVFPENT